MRTRNDDPPAAQSSSRADVVVVGGGPVGLLTAGLLAGLGVSVVVVERAAGEEVFPKGRTLLPRSMEILRQAGLEQRIQSIALDPGLYRQLFRGRTLLAPTDVTAAPRHDYAYSPCRKVICSKGMFETALAEFAAAQGAELRFSTRATEISASQDSVITRVASATPGADQTVQTIESAYVVGADGANSLVRAAAGIGGRTAARLPRSVSVHFRSPLADRMRERTSLLYHLEGGLTVVAVDNEDRWLLMLEHGEDAFDDAAAAVAVRAAIGDPAVPYEVLGTRTWTPSIWLADSLWSGRVILAGDAAHTALPVSGLGMNLGIQDAYALAWRLALLNRGIGTLELLRSYDRERRTVAASNLRLSSRQAQTGRRRPVPEVTCLYRYDVGSDGDDSAEGEISLGRRVPHRWLDRAGSRSTLDLLGYRFTALAGGPDADTTALVKAFESGGIALDVVVLDGVGLAAGQAALVRPDGHVAWIGTPGRGHPLTTPAELVEGLG